LNSSLRLLEQHAYAAIFLVTLLAQLGLPIPAELLLLATGALSADGSPAFAPLLALALAATELAQTAWYEAGRRRGARILGFVCRVSLEPDACVRKTRDLFERLGTRAIAYAFFVPGLSVIAAPMAGTLGMARARFHAWNALGALLWCGGFLALGRLASAQIEAALAVADRVGGGAAVLLVGLLALFVGWRWWRRLRVLAELRMARIEPEELRRLLDAGAELVVVDLRHAVEFEEEPRTIPGALRMRPEEVPQRHEEIPRDRDVVLYCSCPNEVTSARVALLLKRHGVARVRPLLGGFTAWLERGFPLAAANEGIRSAGPRG
jgi:membrane protein DedA with SNARE-associated domain/rhodanese-related sulfurtransferase